MFNFKDNRKIMKRGIRAIFVEIIDQDKGKDESSSKRLELAENLTL